MTIRALALSVAVLFAAGAAEAKAVPKDCWRELKAPLEKGGFSGRLTCDDLYYFDLKYIGRTNGEWKYRIYMYRYTLYAVEGGPGHGGGRLLIFDDHMKYWGQYTLNDHFKGIWIAGSTVHFGYTPKEGNVLKLDGPHPPWVAWFLGDTNGLYK